MKFHLNILILISILCISCKEYKISKQLEEFRKETITIPSDLLKFSGQSISQTGECINSRTLILYYDSLSCSSCQISHLQELVYLYEVSDSLDVSVMSIFSPKAEELEAVIQDLEIRAFDYPVYIDATGSFRNANRGIPSDSRFHYFLLDSDGHPVFVGNPAANDRLWELYLKTIEYLKSKAD